MSHDAAAAAGKAVPETAATLVDAIIRWGRRLIPDRERSKPSVTARRVI